MAFRRNDERLERIENRLECAEARLGTDQTTQACPAEKRKGFGQPPELTAKAIKKSSS